MLDPPRTLPIRFLLAGAFTARIPSVSAFKDGEDFSNNLFSDLAPVLSLFGEQVAKQFMAGSMGWADNILFAMVPLGIITAIVSAIRIGGPGWLKAIIGRARENQTFAEMELTTSTSAEVCELWNGRAVVRMIGAPKILELLCFFSESTNTSDCNHGLFTIPTAVHDKRIKGRLQNHWGTSFIAPMHLGIRNRFTSPAPSSINLKTSDVEASPNSNILLERSSKSTHHDSINQVKLVTVPDLYVPKSSHHGRVRVSVDALPLKAHSAPNISVNLVKRNSLELRYFAALGILVQLGVIFFSAYATYDRPFSNRIGRNENHGYGFPINAIGTVVLALGMIICAFVVESSTRETRWELVDEKTHGKFMLLWLQRGENVNDQVFDSYVIFGSGKRNMVLSSVLATINTSHSNHDSHRSQKQSYQAPSPRNPSNENQVSREMALKLPTETLVIAGSVASISGFVVQFIGLRAMHWSASIAQLIGTLIMVGIRTFVRRDMAEPPHTQKLPHDHELDWLATRMGAEADKGKLWTTGSSVANGVEFWSEDCWEWGIITSSDTTDYRFRRSPKIHSETIPCQGCTWPNKVVSIRSHLGSLSKWTTGMSGIAVELASAIEVVMNAVFATGVSEGSIWQWPLRGKERDLIFLSVKYMNGHWSTNATDIESVLSLWIYASQGRHNSLKPHDSRGLDVNKAESTDEVSHDTPCYSTVDQGDWIRSRDQSLSPINLSFLGPIKRKYLRDLSWYSKNGLSRLEEAQELEADSIPETSNSEKPLESAAKNEKTHTSRGKYGTIIDVDSTRIVGFTCIDKEQERAAPRSTTIRRFRLSPLRGSALRLDNDTVGTSHNLNSCERASTSFSDPYSPLIVMKSEVPLHILYARDMFTTFMWAVATDMNPLCGETTLHASESDWRIFTLENTAVTGIVKDIGKVASRCLGDPDEIYLTIIPPLSIREKLPIPSAVLDHALEIGQSHEVMSQWKQAGEVYTWLFNQCKMLPKELQHRSAALLLEFIASAEVSMKSLVPLHFDNASNLSLPYEPDIDQIREVISSAKELLEKADSTVLKALEFLQLLTSCPETDDLGKIKTSFAGLETFRSASQLHQDMIDGILPELLIDDGRKKNPSIAKGQKSEKKIRRRLNPLEGARDIAEKNLVGLTPLHYCAILGFTEGPESLFRIVDSLKTRPADNTRPSIFRYNLLTDTDIFRRTALHYASALGHEEIVKSLCAERTQVNASFIADVSGKTPLYYARNESVAWLLLSLGSRLDTCDRNGASPLHWMAGRGMSDTVRLFLEAGAAIDCHDNRRLTPLHWAALGGHDRTVKLLITKGASTQSRDVYGRVPLHQTALAKTSTKEMLELLLDNDALLASDRNGFTAVHFAASAGNSATVGLLAELGADVHVTADSEYMYQLTPLHLAARKGHQNVIRNLISEYNVSVDVKDYEGWTPLYWAAYTGQHETVKTLICDYHALIDIINADGETPLHSASYGGHKDTVRVLIKCNADVDAVDKDNWTPLHFAAIEDYAVIAKMLIKEGGANVEAENKDSYTALHQAASRGHSDTVRALVRECGANVEAGDKDSWTALHHAASGGHSDTVRTLIRECGANVEAKEKRSCTALHHAARLGRSGTVRTLIREFGANVEAGDKDSWTALHHAAAKGDSDIVRLLIKECGANVEAEDIDNWTPLHVAAMHGQSDTVRLLIQCGAKIDVVETDNWTPLHFAASNGHSDMVKILIQECGAGVDVGDKDGWTPLHSAASNGHSDTVKLLIQEGGANVESVSWHDWTPLHSAASNGHSDTVKLLIQEGGAKVEGVSWERPNRTPLYFAASGGHIDTVRLLIQEFGANLEAIEEHGWTALHIAAIKGRSDVVRLLVREFNADVGATSRDNITPLAFAAGFGHNETVRVLVQECNANVDAVQRYQRTALHSAASEGQSDTVRLLSLELNANVEATDKDDQKPIHLAAINGHHETVRVLIQECKVNVGSVSEALGTPLHCAALTGNSETMRMLIQEFNADANAATERHGTPIHGGADRGHSEIVRILVLEGNADVEATIYPEKLRPLHLAAASGHKETVRVLMKDCKANVHAVTTGGVTALHLASACGFTATIHILVIEGHAAVNMKDEYGRTALSFALDAGHKKTARALFKLGATYDGDELPHLIQTDSSSQLDSSSIDLSQTIFAVDTDEY